VTTPGSSPARAAIPSILVEPPPNLLPIPQPPATVAPNWNREAALVGELVRTLLAHTEQGFNAHRSAIKG